MPASIAAADDKAAMRSGWAICRKQASMERIQACVGITCGGGDAVTWVAACELRESRDDVITTVDEVWRQKGRDRSEAYRERRRHGRMLVPVEIGPRHLAALERRALLGRGERDKACIAWAVSRFMDDAALHVSALGDALWPADGEAAEEAWLVSQSRQRSEGMTRLQNVPTGCDASEPSGKYQHRYSSDDTGISDMATSPNEALRGCVRCGCWPASFGTVCGTCRFQVCRPARHRIGQPTVRREDPARTARFGRCCY